MHISWEKITDVENDSRYIDREGAVLTLEQAIDAGSVSDAQDALKRALEAVHELADCLQRNEWVQADWTPDELGLWHAHIGARNAAHHTSSAVAVLHSDGGRAEPVKSDETVWLGL